MAKEFLTVLHGLSGSDGVARIGFHLHGAVPMFPSHDTLFADEQESWLSRYLVDREIFVEKKNKRFRQYQLGTRPKASFLNPSAVSEARQLGWLLGKLSRATSVDGQRLLTENDFIVLASCVEPKDAACSIAAELRIFCRWLDLAAIKVARSSNWTSPERTSEAAKELVQGTGYLAINSARLKIEGYREGRAQSTITRCGKFLATLDNGSFLETAWKGEWDAVIAATSQEQKFRFDPWITILTKEVLLAAIGVFTLELSVLSNLKNYSQGRTESHLFNLACRKVFGFLKSISAGMELTAYEKNVLDHLTKRAGEEVPIKSVQGSIDFGLNWLRERAANMRAAANQVEEIAKQFGKTDKIINFSTVLWYDIINSTGQKSGLGGVELNDYRSRVLAFKHDFNRQVYGLRRDAERQNAMVYAWQGPITSKDDEKHIFITGTRNVEWLYQASKLLVSTAEVLWHPSSRDRS